MTDEAQLYKSHRPGVQKRISRSIMANVSIFAAIATPTLFLDLRARHEGIYRHCVEKHLCRYLAEFNFRYNNRIALGTNDEQRAEKAFIGVAGKRLRYRGSPSGAQMKND